MKKDEISSLLLLLICIAIGIATTWWIGVIFFIIGATLISKFIGFSEDKNDSNQTSEKNKPATSSTNKIKWDFSLSKETIRQYLEGYLNYFENKFYQSDDWPNIYRVDDYYKDTILAPLRELLNMNSNELEFIEYSGGDFYIGRVDCNENKQGIGCYHWAIEKDSEGDKRRDMFVGYWNRNERTNYGSYIHVSSDETKTWFEACNEGFRLTTRYGLQV